MRLITNLEIFRLAYHELLRKRGFEESKFKKVNQNSKITQHRIEILDKQITELHCLILKEEQRGNI